MNTEHRQPEVPATSNNTATAATRIAIVVGAGSAAGLDASILRTIRERNPGGGVVLLDGDSYGALPPSHRPERSTLREAIATIGDGVMATSALGAHYGPRPAPFKLAAPPQLTQLDRDRIAAAQKKRERKATRMRGTAPKT